jgi:hypothetical protein
MNVSLDRNTRLVGDTLHVVNSTQSDRSRSSSHYEVTYDFAIHTDMVGDFV